MAKAATASIPPLDPIALSLDLPGTNDLDAVLPSPQPNLVSPRRSNSLQAKSASQFPPIYTSIPTSPVYTPHPTSTIRSALQLGDATPPPQLNIDFPFSSEKGSTRPSSFLSETSTNSSIPSPLVASFPSVPLSSPPLPDPASVFHGDGHQLNTSRPRPARAPSFFEATPLSAAPVGHEFLPSSGTFSKNMGHGSFS